MKTERLLMGREESNQTNKQNRRRLIFLLIHARVKFTCTYIFQTTYGLIRFIAIIRNAYFHDTAIIKLQVYDIGEFHR